MTREFDIDNFQNSDIQLMKIILWRFLNAIFWSIVLSTAYIYSQRCKTIDSWTNMDNPWPEKYLRGFYPYAICTLLNFNILYTIDTNIKNLFKNLSKSKEVLTKGMLIEKVKWRKLKRRECCLLCKKRNLAGERWKCKCRVV